MQQEPANPINVWINPSVSALDAPLREALSRLVPVKFISFRKAADCKKGEAIIDLSGDDEIAGQLPRGEHHCFKVVNGIRLESSEAGKMKPIRFSNSRKLDKRIRGRQLLHDCLSEPEAIQLSGGDEVLAAYEEHPIWVLRKTGGVPENIVSVGPPKLGSHQRVFDFFKSEHFIKLLPLLHFLREAASDVCWNQPPIRACFVFDDPNLHWTSYGYLPFEKLATLAKDCNFHATFATVPLDTWMSHPKTVQLFRDSSRYLSLMVHGNDHLKFELSQLEDLDFYLQMLAQSLRRITRLEQHTGLSVSRVMVPPHEAFSETAQQAMRALGFDGVCISRSSLCRWNPDKVWPTSFDLEPGEMAGGDLPILPRFGLDYLPKTLWENAIVLGAYLDRPIIPAGHHDTVAGGIEILDHVSKIINSLDDVRWMSPGNMLRSCCLTRRQGSLLWIRPYACNLEFEIPEGVTSVVIDPPASMDKVKKWILTPNRASHSMMQHVLTDSFKPAPVSQGLAMTLTAKDWGQIDYRKVKSPRSSPSAITRRILCEARDRLIPFAAKIKGGVRTKSFDQL